MELSKAREQLEELIGAYSAKISKFGTKIVANTYLADSKCFAICEEDDKYLGSLCASITIIASDAEDENGMCGFDTILSVKKGKKIDDEEFEASVAEFKALADEFTEKFEAAPDKDEFIRAESESQKSKYAEEMEKFDKEMLKMKSCVIAVTCGVALLFVISAVLAIIFG